MTYTFKLARRLARFRFAGLLVTLFTLACAGAESPNGPGSDPTSDDPTAIDVFPDTATVGVDGEVLFDAAAVPAGETTASYRSWWRNRYIVSVRVDPDSVKLAAGSTQTFSATGRTSYGHSVKLTLEWKATGGTVDQSGKYLAGKTPGNYIVIASTSTGVADTAKVVVTGSTGGTTTRQVLLTPESVTLAPGEEQRYSLAGKLSDGSSFSVDPRYTATGGTISDWGMFTSGPTSGTYRVIATDQGTGLADTSAVTIGGSGGGGGGTPTVGSVTVSPASTSLTVGATRQLSATVKDGSGGTIAGATVSWASSNTAVTRVSTSGMVTALARGDARITGSSGGKSDDAAITVTSEEPAPAPPPSGGGDFTACDNLPAADRTVNVSSQSALSSALSNAQPGDRIVLASGTYSGGKRVSGRSGTQSNPIVVCGPRTAVWTGDLRTEDMDWWIFQGFTIRDGFQTFHAKRSSFNRIQGLEIYNVGQEAIHFLCNSTDNVIEATWIHNTGTGSRPEWGEAVYLGSTSSNSSSQCGTSTDLSHRNQVLNNRFGPYVRSEDVDAKEHSRDGVIRGNTSDGTGKLAISANFEASIAVKGSTSGYQVTDNVLAPAAQDGSTTGKGIFVYGGAQNTVVRRNRIDMTGGGSYGLRIDASGTVCSADNLVTNGTRSNVACNAP